MEKKQYNLLIRIGLKILPYIMLLYLGAMLIMSRFPNQTLNVAAFIMGVILLVFAVAFEIVLIMLYRKRNWDGKEQARKAFLFIIIASPFVDLVAAIIVLPFLYPW